MPPIDLNTLDEKHEIRIEVTPRGYIIRKVPRFEGCFFWLVAISLLLIGVSCWVIFVYEK